MKLVVLPQLGFKSFLIASVTAVPSCPVLPVEVLPCFLAVWHQSHLTDRHAHSYMCVLIQLNHVPVCLCFMLAWE